VRVRLQALPRAAKEGRGQQRAWVGKGKREGRTQLQEGRRQQKEGRRQEQEGRRQASIHQLRQIDCPNINVFIAFSPWGSFGIDGVSLHFAL
jgi:hypothetical protein